ncbi:MAG: cyclic nucleotide-binding domain-containing protein [Treponema sp.]|jgi:CRP-like cAMP-binding protein|nr:cyclic nucleotide-binding domain-containing protein [Treponema sp.]
MSEIKPEGLDLARFNAVLLHSPFFKDLTGPEYAAAASFLDCRAIPRGTVVYREGEPGGELYICLTGVFNASVGLSGGARRGLFTIKPGDFFGETAVISREPHDITVTSEEASSAAVLRFQEFNRILSDYPFIGVKLLRNINRVQSGRFEESAKYMDDLIRWGDTARRPCRRKDRPGPKSRVAGFFYLR